MCCKVLSAWKLQLALLPWHWHGKQAAGTFRARESFSLVRSDPSCYLFSVMFGGPRRGVRPSFWYLLYNTICILKFHSQVTDNWKIWSVFSGQLAFLRIEQWWLKTIPDSHNKVIKQHWQLIPKAWDGRILWKMSYNLLFKLVVWLKSKLFLSNCFQLNTGGKFVFQAQPKLTEIVDRNFQLNVFDSRRSIF